MTALSTKVLIGVIGAGAMGSGIAQVALNAGHRVVLHDAASAALERGVDSIRAAYSRLLAKGKISTAQHDDRLARLTSDVDIASLAEAGLVIEAIVENIDIKTAVLIKLEALLAADAIIATNTSSLSVTAIAARLQRPERVIGMHFFNPAPILPLVEVVSGKVTSQDVVATIFATAQAWKKIAVHCKSTPGFIVNRVARPFYGEALRLLAEGAADAATLDAVLRESGGFRMGAFELMDMIGHDVNYAVTQSVYDALFQDPRYKPSLLQKDLVDAGWLGKKTGRGFYQYAEPLVAPAVQITASAAVPSTVIVEGDLGPAEKLVALAEQAGLTVTRTDGVGILRIDGVAVALTDGRSATERANDLAPVQVLFDLALDYDTATLVAIAKADQASDHALAVAAGFFQKLGKKVVVLDDAPGLIVMRTVAMLCNEAAEMVQQAIATTEAVDLAMVNGVNYPRGPLAWGDAIGLTCIRNVIQNLAISYGEDRYRVAPLLRRMTAANRTFYAERAR
ncbi:3-hydroxyacyl-CoA dehydrogenase [Glaciimonas sp. PCH181]|uniref:3-hydroxyacyl-CoA dehydrogenase n=1 Tax=Glaciimonas sp. PCH181 TaxID=2133943 RepID=UPI000D3871FE|nr:3-hydroxyacyl-CoA dehydrogenase [Glaciimonas sp. PCH181]PUA16337.1 3-hydroxyacyl-CoA dehydrogenase [Glaciimonas sp. PCH181]